MKCEHCGEQPAATSMNVRVWKLISRTDRGDWAAREDWKEKTVTVEVCDSCARSVRRGPFALMAVGAVGLGIPIAVFVLTESVGWTVAAVIAAIVLGAALSTLLLGDGPTDRSDLGPVKEMLEQGWTATNPSSRPGVETSISQSSRSG